MSGVEIVAAFGVFANFLQVADFTANVAKQAYKQVKSGQEILAENVETTKLGQEYERLGALFHNDNTNHAKSEEEKGIVKLGQTCQEEAKKLLEKLESLSIRKDVTGFRRFAESAKQATKARFKREDIDNHRRYLVELNGQLTTALLHAFSSEKLKAATDRARLQEDARIEEQLRGFAKLVEEHPEQYDSAERARRVLEIRHLNRTSDIEIAANLGGQLASSMTEFANAITRKILEALDFAEISARWENISVSYPTTYQWALTDETIGLRSWLRDGNGIFWISGKAGSGKSTLIKFIEGAPDTKSLLQEWCEGRELVIATFYFWYVGSKLQKSIGGLLRTILYKIIQENPAQAPVALPSAFDYGQSVEADALKRRPRHFTHDELVSALERIAEFKSTAQTKRFCLFIDGLDEYHGNHIELIALLRRLSKNREIKICVSSRPWNPFIRAFELGTPNLKLEDLSFPDMQRYVQGSLESMAAELAAIDNHCGAVGNQDKDEDKHEHEHEAKGVTLSELADQIVSRGEGVFLWVHLVTKSVLIGLAEGEPIWMLRRRVQQFPADLETFFHQILGRVEVLYKKQSAQALKLAYWNAQKEEIQPDSSWLDFWLISRHTEGLQDVRFAFDFTSRKITQKEWEKMFKETRIFLGSACKDLLLMSSAKMSPTEPRDVKVEFLHKTVYEFLTADFMQNAINKQLPPLFLDRSVRRSFSLVRCKAIGLDESAESRQKALTLMMYYFSTAAKKLRTLEYVIQCDTTILRHRNTVLSSVQMRNAPLENAPIQNAIQNSPQATDGFSFLNHNFVGELVLSSALLRLLDRLIPEYQRRMLDRFRKTQIHRAWMLIVPKELVTNRTGQTTRYALGVAPTIAAALGEWPARYGPLHDSSPMVLQRILELGEWICVCEGWHFFVRKWITEQRYLQGEQKLRKVWRIAKMFVKASTYLSNPVCRSSFWKWSLHPADDRLFSALVFIESQIPAAWLKEDDWKRMSATSVVAVDLPESPNRIKGRHRIHYISEPPS